MVDETKNGINALGSLVAFGCPEAPVNAEHTSLHDLETSARLAANMWRDWCFEQPNPDK